MGRLFDYFFSLNEGDKINNDIVDAIKNPVTDNAGEYPCYVFDPNNGRHWEQKGTFLKNYNSWYIPYVEGKIISHKIVQGQDALSYDFSGCAFARFIDDNYDINVAHIFLKGINDLYDCRKVWNNFVHKRCMGKPIIFKPYAPLSFYTDNPLPHFKTCLGLISHSKDCYQISVTFFFNSQITNINFNYMEKAKPQSSENL